MPVAPHAELFTCGLLSGVGRLGLATVYPDDYSDLLARSRGCGDDGLLELERRTFSLDHNQLTAAMMLDWGIPKLFSETVLLHEGPDDCGFAVGSRAYSLVYLLHLASRLAASCFMADHERSAQLPRLFATAEKIGITPEQLVRLGDRMLDEWRDWSRLLQLHIHDDVEPFSSLDALSSGVHDDFADPDFARGIRLLIADDDAALVMLLSKKIASLGYTVYTAADGRQALEQIAAHAPHMVLSDVLMPEIDGIELCRTLRRRLEGRGVYFILLTAHKEKGHLVEAFQAGADDFVIKPVTVPALLGRLAAGTRIVRLQAKLEAEQARLHGEDAAGAGEMLDRISGLPSRRYAMIRLKEQWALAERNNVPFSCLRVSLGWKGGHDPEQLKTLLPHAARLLREASRAEDVICHFGEGQFFIVSPHSVLSTAMHFGERLLVRLAEMPATADGAALCVAIGATARSTAVRDEMQLLRLAEAALAQAVERGGGRAVSAMADEEAPGGVVFN
ncbi:response regulator [Methylogaea oryzae]|uniref:response regulator n=1 Tax=Methylogaea oryzae TaxID=1295382 RepID=UPI0006D28408|nr:response regulator [Methylogaea oryzae]